MMIYLMFLTTYENIWWFLRNLQLLHPRRCRSPTSLLFHRRSTAPCLSVTDVVWHNWFWKRNLEDPNLNLSKRYDLIEKIINDLKIIHLQLINNSEFFSVLALDSWTRISWTAKNIYFQFNKNKEQWLQTPPFLLVSFLHIQWLKCVYI